MSIQGFDRKKMTKVRNKIRVLLASCFADDWTNQIGTDLEIIADDLGFEFILLADGPNKFVKDSNYFALDEFARKFDLTSITASSFLEKGLLDELKKFQFLFEKAGGPDRSIDLTMIDEQMERWFVEAVCALRMIQPDWVIVWNGHLTKRGVYAKAVQYLNIPFVYAEKGVFPESWCLDDKGINASSTLRHINYDAVKGRGLEYWRDKIKEIDASGASAWEQPPMEDLAELKRQLGINERQKVIFFPGQVDADSNIILYSPYFKNSPEVLKWLVGNLNEEDFFILVKPHPKGFLSESDFTKLLGDKGKSVSSINVLDAIRISDCIVTINSSVAFEAALRQKPVLLLGEGILSGKKFVHSYIPNVNSDVLIRKTINEYESNKDSYYASAIAFADYLDDKYYLYRKNIAKTKQRLLSYLGTISILQSNRLSREELSSIMAPLKANQVAPYLTKGVLFKIFLRKLKNKLRWFKK